MAKKYRIELSSSKLHDLKMEWISSGMKTSFRRFMWDQYRVHLIVPSSTNRRKKAFVTLSGGSNERNMILKLTWES